jgi:beta-glucosidase-like glycosyl hydrolase
MSRQDRDRPARSASIGFEGLVFTDALNMKGVATPTSLVRSNFAHCSPATMCLLFPQDPVKAIERIRKAVDDKD